MKYFHANDNIFVDIMQTSYSNLTLNCSNCVTYQANDFANNKKTHQLPSVSAE